MKITTLFGLKGGVGKTRVVRDLVVGMLACEVPVGAFALTDPWGLERMHEALESSFGLAWIDEATVRDMAAQPCDVRAHIEATLPDCEHVIVDTPRYPNAAYEAALAVSDVIVLPTSPGEELRDFPRTVEAVRRAQLAQQAAGRVPARVLVLFLWRTNEPVQPSRREAMLRGTGFEALLDAQVSHGEMPWTYMDPRALEGCSTTRELLLSFFGPEYQGVLGIDTFVEEVLALHGQSWPLHEYGVMPYQGVGLPV